MYDKFYFVYSRNLYSSKLYIFRLVSAIIISQMCGSTVAIIAIDNYRNATKCRTILSIFERKKMRRARSVLILVRKVFSNSFHVENSGTQKKSREDSISFHECFLLSFFSGGRLGRVTRSSSTRSTIITLHKGTGYPCG